MQSGQLLTLVNAAAMTGNINSTPLSTQQSWAAALQAVWSGTPTGSLKLQASNDNVNWTDVPSTSQALAGAAGSYMFLPATSGPVPYPYLRVAYVFTSGTGTLTVTAVKKDN